MTRSLTPEEASRWRHAIAVLGKHPHGSPRGQSRRDAETTPRRARHTTQPSPPLLDETRPPQSPLACASSAPEHAERRDDAEVHGKHQLTLGQLKIKTMATKKKAAKKAAKKPAKKAAKRKK